MFFFENGIQIKVCVYRLGQTLLISQESQFTAFSDSHQAVFALTSAFSKIKRKESSIHDVLVFTYSIRKFIPALVALSDFGSLEIVMARNGLEPIVLLNNLILKGLLSVPRIPESFHAHLDYTKGVYEAFAPLFFLLTPES